ncbi:hypothetical protein P3S67_000623 [Capsicum chacoense]
MDLLKWSLSHADGTNPPRNLSEEDRKWFMEAMQAQTVDVIKRMKEITLVMQTPKQDLESRGGRGDFSRYRRQDMLDELQEHVESIDMANALVRHNKPGIAAFLLANGYATLRGALSSERRFQRKYLTLIHYLLHENRSDCNVVTELGFPQVLMHIASSEDGEVRQGACEDFLSLPKTGQERMLAPHLLKKMRNSSKYSRRESRGFPLSPEDLDAAKEERQLVDSLWNICYNESLLLFERKA